MNIIDYASAANYLGNRTRRTLPSICATSIVRRDADTIAVRYHLTDVVTYHSDGGITLNSGGWRTATTKDRMNTFANAGIYQKKGTWFYGDSVYYHDGMRIGVTL